MALKGSSRGKDKLIHIYIYIMFVLFCCCFFLGGVGQYFVAFLLGGGVLTFGDSIWVKGKAPILGGTHSFFWVGVPLFCDNPFWGWFAVRPVHCLPAQNLPLNIIWVKIKAPRDRRF